MVYMDEKDTLKNELIESIRKQRQPNHFGIDFNEVIIISVATFSLTGGLVSGRLSETAFVGLMGTFLGYTFGRIFNHVQGKE